MESPGAGDDDDDDDELTNKQFHVPIACALSLSSAPTEADIFFFSDRLESGTKMTVFESLHNELLVRKHAQQRAQRYVKESELSPGAFMNTLSHYQFLM